MNTLSIESKLPSVGTSIFTVMSALAREHGAVNLSQGFPDFEVDPVLIDLAYKHMKAGNNQYSPSSGQMVLRERVSALLKHCYEADYDAESEITITSGATEALYAAITAMTDPGDEVLIFEPAYDSYVPAIELNGGIPVYVPLEYPNYRIDWEGVKKRINQRTRLIILNSPHNPTGTTMTDSDMQELSKIVKDKEIFILSDEVYEHILFDGTQHAGVARYPELAHRSFLISSFGKTFHATGWKVGYCAAPAELMREFRKVHQFLTFSTSTPFQFALADYMEDLTKLDTLSTFYQEKRDYFRKLLEGSRFEIMDCDGTYFQSLGYKAISDEKDTEFARRLTIEHGIASIPVSVFYHSGEDNKVLRFCFAKSNETLEKAAKILKSI